MYAAPVTSNVIREMPATATWRREVWLFGSELFVSRFTLSVPSGRARAVQLRAVWIVSLELFVHSERIRNVTQGACIYIFVLHSCAILLLLKYIINENELFAEQKIYT